EGHDIVTTTDASGRYTLAGVPEGSTKLTASYLGMDSRTQEITVVAGKTAVLEFSLEPSLRTSITVTAEPFQEGQAKALNDQKSSLTLVNVVAADQIGRFPDPNAAEATQRIPGIT